MLILIFLWVKAYKTFHHLGRPPPGWRVIGLRGRAIISVYDSSDSRNLTLFNGNGFSAELVGNTVVPLGEQVHVSIIAIPDNNYTQLSAMLIDSEGSVVCYGKISDDIKPGQISIAIPENITAGAYRLRVFAECINSIDTPHMVDYSSDNAEWTIVLYETSATLPSSLYTVGEEAFANCIIDCIQVPSTVENIESRAFADCNALQTIVFSNASLQIAEDAFYNSRSVSFVAPPGGDVEEYARDHNIPFFEK